MLAAILCGATCAATALGAAGRLTPPWRQADAAIQRIVKADQKHQDRMMWQYVAFEMLVQTEADQVAVNKWSLSKKDEFRAPQAGPAAVRAILDEVVTQAYDPRAVGPLYFVATYDGSSAGDVKAAVELLRKYHATNAECVCLMGYDPLKRLDWFAPMLRDQLASDQLTEDQRHRLRFSLAQYLKRHGTAPAEKAEALGHFEALAAAGVKLRYMEGFDFGPSIAEVSRHAAYALKHLAVGLAVPELEGEGIDGKPLKLSDYRGQVVLVSFWAANCGPCRAIVPAERAAAKRYEGRPFAVLGVNVDSDPALARKRVEKWQMGWRSLWCGPEGGMSAIPTGWNVEGIPALFVIDHAGKIRARPHHADLLDGSLDALLDGLVKEAEAAK